MKLVLMSDRMLAIAIFVATAGGVLLGMYIGRFLS